MTPGAFPATPPVGADDLRQARDAARLIRDQLRHSATLLEGLCTGLERCLELALQGSIQAPDPCPVTAGLHRRNHRPGRPAILEADPELRAFVESRIGHMTFVQIAEAVAARFPPERRVGKTAVHAWWRRHRKRITAGQALNP